MAKVKIKVGKTDVEKGAASGDFEEAPPGLYTAVLDTCKPGHAKGEDGKPDKSRPYLECIYKFTGEGRDGDKLSKNYGQVWDYVSFSEAAKWKLAQFAMAMGIPVNAKGELDGELEIEDGKPGTVIGREVIVRIKKDSDQDGNYRAKVGAVMPMEGPSDSGSSAFGDDDDDEPEEGDSTDDPFDGDEEGDDEGGDMLTNESLEALDNKELGAVARDFDLEPKDFLGKRDGKTIVKRKALIEAILEAQDGTEGTDGDDDLDDEEDPF